MVPGFGSRCIPSCVQCESQPAMRPRLTLAKYEYSLRLTRKLEAEFFAQKKRLADAERTLKTKQAKTALNDRRIATDKLSKLDTRLADLRRMEAKDRDSRSVPF